METIGKILPNGKIKRDYNYSGLIYKNPEAFLNKTNEPCYQGENYDEDHFETYNSIINQIKERFEDMGVNGDVEKTAELVFNHASWQSIETLLDELEEDMEENPETYGII
jgi:hypothetical protein